MNITFTPVTKAALAEAPSQSLNPDLQLHKLNIRRALFGTAGKTITLMRMYMFDKGPLNH